MRPAMPTKVTWLSFEVEGDNYSHGYDGHVHGKTEPRKERCKKIIVSDARTAY